MSSSSDQRSDVRIAARHRSGGPAAPGSARPHASLPRLDDEVRVWLSSEFVDPVEYFRFDRQVAIYEAARWPLGLTPGRNSEERVAMAGMSDGNFDWHVRCALHLPFRYSGLRFGPPQRRDRADLWIRHVGHWNGDPSRLAEILAGLARLPHGRIPGRNYRALYALTPFAIIGQTWCEAYDRAPAFMIDTTIAFFYTFEALIQECLIREALEAGARATDVVALFEHRYSRIDGQPNLLVNDPSTLKLARYGNAAIDWDSLRATRQDAKRGKRSPGWTGRADREFLFDSRLQTHLMVAIAAACHGLCNFTTGQISSPLVQTLEGPPTIDALAPHWLGHVTGGYDHAAACADLLESLAQLYEKDLSSDLRGMPIPPWRSPSDPVEDSIASTRPHLWGCTFDGAFDAYRWKLFDAALDDASVRRWAREASDWVEHGWPAAVPPDRAK